MLIRYDDWFDDLDGTVALVAEHLGLPAPTRTQLDAIAVHCDPSLRRSQPDDVAPHPLLQQASELYTELHSGDVSGVVDRAAKLLAGLSPP